MTEFKLVPLSDIKPDPNQPRKFYDESAMQELTDSVREKGILQPVLIRPNGKGHILVCGERRYKAATAAGLKEIPAVIRKLSDEEALELQIIENLQRKDVHPMEEAVAFKSLFDKGKDIKEIAARVGKSEFYVRQRIKLCAMTKDWQGAFFQNRISITEALKVALFDIKVQNELFKEVGGGSRTIELGNWSLRKYRGDLVDAPFDTADPTLDKKVGACVNCKFNTATAALFEDAGISPKCNNLPCFTNKCNLHFVREFDIACSDPAVVLVHDFWAATSDKWVKKAEGAGHAVYGSNAYDKVNPPEIESFEEWKEDNDEYNDTEARKQYQQEMDEYNQSLKVYQEKVAGGKYKKAFLLTGNDKGKYIYITLNKNSKAAGSSKAVKQKEESGQLSAADIDQEIKRIRDKEKRTKEIDQNQVWGELKTHFSPKNNIAFFSGELTQVEREATAAALYEKLDYGGQDQFKKVFQFKKVDSGYRSGYDFSAITKEELLKLIRFFMLTVLPPSMLYDGFNNHKVCLKVAHEYFPDVLKGIQDKQNEKAQKRNERIDKRIADLQKKKKELSASKKGKKQPAK